MRARRLPAGDLYAYAVSRFYGCVSAKTRDDLVNDYKNRLYGIYTMRKEQRNSGGSSCCCLYVHQGAGPGIPGAVCDPMKQKTFDCIQMKRQGAECIRKQLEGKTLPEQLEYWQKGTEALKKRQEQLRRKA